MYYRECFCHLPATQRNSDLLYQVVLRFHPVASHNRHTPVTELFVINARDFDVDVDTVEAVTNIKTGLILSNVSLSYPVVYPVGNALGERDR